MGAAPPPLINSWTRTALILSHSKFRLARLPAPPRCGTGLLRLVLLMLVYGRNPALPPILTVRVTACSPQARRELAQAQHEVNAREEEVGGGLGGEGVELESWWW
jgi:hypothetical protein